MLYLKSDEFVVIADTHFSHGNIIKYCDRPFPSIKEMNDKLWSGLLKADKEGKIIIHLGDFMFGNHWPYSWELPNRDRHYYIVGNHDQDRHFEHIKKCFGNIIGTSVSWKKNVLIAEIIDGESETMDIVRLAFSHEPQHIDFLDAEGVDYNVYGHHHNNLTRYPEKYIDDYNWLLKTPSTYICGCVELFDYSPASYDELLRQDPLPSYDDLKLLIEERVK